MLLDFEASKTTGHPVCDTSVTAKSLGIILTGYCNGETPPLLHMKRLKRIRMNVRVKTADLPKKKKIIIILK